MLAVSWAAIFVRWCGNTPALIIAFYRMLWATGIFAGFNWYQSRSWRPPRLTARHFFFTFAAGLMLALHFATWIGSLKFTTVAEALTLGSTSPIFALLLAPILLKEKSDRRAIFAVLLALAGIAMIAGQDFQTGTNRFLGDLLALSSALFVTLYLFIARFLRTRVELIPYLMLVYGSATLILLSINLFADYPLVHYPTRVHLFMLFLALIPTGVGHSLFNWAARHIEVYKINLAVLGEPLIASILAYFLFAELPHGWFFAGAVLILTGIVLALWERRE